MFFKMIINDNCYRLHRSLIRHRIKKILVADIDVIYCTILLHISIPWDSEHKYKKYIKT